MKTPLILFFLLLFFSGSLFAEVAASGRAEIFNDNETSARKQALQNALRDAVEKGVGLLLDAKTQTENWQVIRDEVYSTAQGYITGYKTTRDERVGKVWFIEIQAKVAQGKIKDKFGQLRILHKKMGNKRFMVIYRPEQNQSQEVDSPPTQAALRGLQRALNKAGFRLFDQKATNRLYPPNSAREDWLKIAQDEQVDILIEYEVLASGATRPGQAFNAAKTTVIARVFDVSTGRMISSQSATQKQITNARVGSFDWNNALSRAGEKAGLSAADGVTNEVVQYYQSIGDQGKAFFIRFEGFTTDETDQLLDLLEAMEGYQNLSELTQEDLMLEIEYFSNLNKSRLRRKLRLEAKKIGIRLAQVKISGNRMHFIKQ